MTDHTHDPNLTSWIDVAPSSDFTIQNLPYGIYRRAVGNDEPRIGVAIGDQILDIAGCIAENLLEGLAPETACALSASTLNNFFAQGPKAWRETRHAISSLLSRESATLRDNDQLQSKLLVPMSEADMLLPAAIGDYTDFYASIHHATNVGSMFRPDNPLLPNYKHLPVGYHGRASSIVPSGTDIRRPKGQTKADDAEFPTYGPCRLLDYELELGFFVGPGNEMGSPITMQDASSHIFGMVLLNDWSARDVQKWEYQPLGPFNAKNFATTISPWVVTLDALEPYRIPGPPPRGEGDPPIIDYLQPADDMGLDITVEAYLSSKQMREQGAESLRLSRGNFREMYWTIAQMLTHHASTGCNMRPGDLLGSGTISGPDEENRGCLLERTWRGQNPIPLPDGTQRKFLQDGDEVIIKAFCEKEGVARVGFGECRGVVLPAG